MQLLTLKNQVNNRTYPETPPLLNHLLPPPFVARASFPCKGRAAMARIWASIDAPRIPAIP